MQLIKIVIAHNQSLFRSGINSLLEKVPGIFILGEASNERDLLTILNHYVVDVLLLDPALPLLHGQLSCQAIKQRYPSVEMVILSSYLESRQVAHYLQLGATTCLDKNCGKDALVQAIQNAYNRKSSTVKVPVLQEPNAPEFQNRNYLTDREREVLHHICKGKTNKEIAESLSISLRTVDFHRKNLYDKTHTQTPAALAVYAIKYGILEL